MNNDQNPHLPRFDPQPRTGDEPFHSDGQPPGFDLLSFWKWSASGLISNTQRGYDLSISPQVAQIASNAGAGQFGVAAPLSAVWEAIVTQPWITLVGGSNGIGDGNVRYSVAQNDTGQVRTGRIIVAGEEYTITQITNLLVTVDAADGGTATGGGNYGTNDIATLTATPDAGYVFSHWTGDAVGSQNPLMLNVDSNKSLTGHFIPSTAADSFTDAAVQSIVAAPEEFGLFTAEQFQDLAMGAPLLEKDPTTGVMNLSIQLQESTTLQGWLDVTPDPGDVSVVDGKLKIEITPQGDAEFFRFKGSVYD